MLDLALTEVDGQITLHTANCPEARMMAFLGFPVATMFGCEREPMDVRRHSCLDPSDDTATLRPTRRTGCPR